MIIKKHTKDKDYPISNLTDWEGLVFTSKKNKHWKEGRSAYSLADFIMNKEGVEKIKELVAPQIEEQFSFDEAFPEYEVRFDKYGKGREHDLAIFGKTVSGKKLFVGVEAKVNEAFGDSIAKAYHKGKVKELNNEPTNAPLRIEKLLKYNFKKVVVSDFNLPYQLLFSTAGTLSDRLDADIRILLVLVFKTSDYNPKIGEQNKKGFDAFLKRLEANQVANNSYKFVVDSKELAIIYKEIDFLTNQDN